MDTFDSRSERRPGHFWADNEVLDVYAPQIGIFGFAVYMAVVRFTDTHGVAKPSIATLAKRLAVGENTVRRAIDTLVQAGLLRVEQQTRERDGRTTYLSNRYVICNVPKGDEAGYFPSGGTSRGEPPTSRGEPPTSRGEPPTSRGEPPVNLNKTLNTKPSSKNLKQQQAAVIEVAEEETPEEAAAALLSRIREKRGRNGRE